MVLIPTQQRTFITLTNANNWIPGPGVSSTELGQEHIYLMAHSGGTLLGIQAAARAPERFHVYVGVAQMTNQLESEKLAYGDMLSRFRELGDANMVRKLEAAPVPLDGGTPAGYLAMRDVAMNRLGGTMHQMTSVFRGIFLGFAANARVHARRKGASVAWQKWQVASAPTGMR